LERRETPRIKFPNKTGFTVKLIMKRFFLSDRVIWCILRDYSDGGASLRVKDEYSKYVNPSNLGKQAYLVSENTEIPFRLKKKGRILRVIEKNSQKSIVIIFPRSAS
jgi:hypothetical protein